MADSELGELRRAPRVMEDRILRAAGFRRSGMAGGQADTVYPVTGSTDNLTVGDTDGGTDAATPEWFHERFHLTAGSPRTIVLAAIPIDMSEIVTLNGLKLTRSVDYTIDDQVITLNAENDPLHGIGDDTWTLEAAYPFWEMAYSFEAPNFLGWQINGDAELDGNEIVLVDGSANQASSIVCPVAVPAGWSVIDLIVRARVLGSAGDGFAIGLLDATEYSPTWVGEDGSHQGLTTAAGNPGYCAWMAYSYTVDLIPASIEWNDGSGVEREGSSVDLNYGVTSEYHVRFTRTASDRADVDTDDGASYSPTPADAWVPPESVYIIISGGSGSYAEEITIEDVTVDVELTDGTPAEPSAPGESGGGTSDPGSGDPTPDPSGMTLVLDEDFSGSLNTAIWDVENSTYGAPQRVQRYLPANVTIAAASSGGGDSLMLESKRQAYGGNDFTAGMVSTRDLDVFYPVLGRYTVRMKMPHCQGVWPAFWLRHRDGSNMCEIDGPEYFHAEEPGKGRFTLHRKNNAGTYQDNVSKRSVFFEAPTLTPDFHDWTLDLDLEGDDIRVKGFLDDAEVWSYLDTQSHLWAVTRGLEHPDSDGGRHVFDICIQGAQINGKYVGHPDDPKGYSRLKGGCIASTSPGVCKTAVGGYNIWTDAADYGGTGLSSGLVTEIASVKVWSRIP